METVALTRNILKNVYQGAIGQYEKTTKELEQIGVFKHLEASVKYRKTIGDNDMKYNYLEDLKAFTNSLDIRIRQVKNYAKKISLTRTFSFLEVQDQGAF